MLAALSLHLIPPSSSSEDDNDKDKIWNWDKKSLSTMTEFTQKELSVLYFENVADYTSHLILKVIWLSVVKVFAPQRAIPETCDLYDNWEQNLNIHCDPSIKGDMEQHSQFLQFFSSSWTFQNSLFFAWRALARCKMQPLIAWIGRSTLVHSVALLTWQHL